MLLSRTSSTARSRRISPAPDSPALVTICELNPPRDRTASTANSGQRTPVRGVTCTKMLMQGTVGSGHGDHITRRPCARSCMSDTFCQRSGRVAGQSLRSPAAKRRIPGRCRPSAWSAHSGSLLPWRWVSMPANCRTRVRAEGGGRRRSGVAAPGLAVQVQVTADLGDGQAAGQRGMDSGVAVPGRAGRSGAGRVRSTASA
jgi:hypothetical protein